MVQIWMYFVILFVVCSVCLIGFLLVDASVRRAGRMIVGTVCYWQKSGIPGFGRVCMDYTIRGKRHQCMSGLIANRNKHLFREKSMHQCVLYKYAGTSKRRPFYVATVLHSVHSANGR